MPPGEVTQPARNAVEWSHSGELALAGNESWEAVSQVSEGAEATMHTTPGDSMDILVMLEENPEHSPVLAHVNSVPSPLDRERPSRDIVTIYGEPTAESIALALAAAVEIHRDGTAAPQNAVPPAIHHLGVWPERGGVGDTAWRDATTGQLVTRDLEIPLARLHATARQLLGECGQIIRRLVAGLSMPDWPDGARRAISVTLRPIVGLTAPMFQPLESALEKWREAEGLAFDSDD